VIGLTIALLTFLVLWAITDWRLALLLCLATAILQDVLRKLTPDQPVLFVACVAVVFGAACVGARARGNPLNLNRVFRRDRHLAISFLVLLLLIILQAFNSYIRFENPPMTAIGLATYLLPFLSIAFAYQLVFRQGEYPIVQFMKWYIVCITIALTTVYLEFLGYRSPVLGQVGAQFIVFDQATGAILQSSSGIFRASEIAGWHAMTAACFLLSITFLRRITLTRLLAVVLLVALIVATGLLTGRRKVLIEFAVFAGTYFILWALLEKRVGKLAITAATGAALVGYAWMASELTENSGPKYTPESLDFSLYVERSQSVFREAPSRFVELGIAPIMWAYDSFGLFGAGLGSGTQGTQHFGAEAGVSGAAEGGLGKITLELGIPGLLLMGWLAILLVRHLWQIMRIASRYSLKMGRLSFGLCSFIVANIAAFSVATQAFGDFFILLILSWTLAFLLAVPVLIEREVRARQVATFEKLAPVLQPKTA
jgi:hypothetical protein